MALPARLGLVVIGGEGAIVLGGVAAAARRRALVTALAAASVLPLMALAAMVAGGIWIGTVGALRHYRGVNETIASLLMAYIAIALMNHLVEGPLRDPACLNKPSTAPLADAYAIGNMPGHRGRTGASPSASCCLHLLLGPDRPDDLGLRRPHRRRQRARGAGAGPAGRAG